MNEIKINVVSLSDLRRLGHQGGATARLDDGSEMKLLAKFGTVRKIGYVNGEIQSVDVIQDYAKIYSQIRTIMRNGILIARKERIGSNTLLKLTGRGYSK